MLSCFVFPLHWKIRCADMRRGDGGEQHVRWEHPAAMLLPDRIRLNGTQSTRRGWGGLSLFGVTQKDTWGTPFVSAEPAYYGLSPWLPPALRLMICTVLRHCVFTWSLRPVILLSTCCAAASTPRTTNVATLKPSGSSKGFICWDRQSSWWRPAGRD